jgi:hypothetical protein
VLIYQVNLPEGLPENVGKTPKSIGFAQHFPYEHDHNMAIKQGDSIVISHMEMENPHGLAKQV